MLINLPLSAALFSLPRTTQVSFCKLLPPLFVFNSCKCTYSNDFTGNEIMRIARLPYQRTVPLIPYKFCFTFIWQIISFYKVYTFLKIYTSPIAGKNVRDTISTHHQIFCPVVVISASVTSVNLS